MSELKLKPELLPMVIQGGFYLAALASAHFLLIKPLLSLTAERRRRTQGAVDSAKGLESKLEKLERTYTEAQQFALNEARDLRNAQILAGQAEAQGVLLEANETAKSALGDVRAKVSEQMALERAKIPGIVGELSDTVLGRLVQPTLVMFAVGAALFSMHAEAASGTVDPIYGILWPYFQFIVFAAALTFFAGKAIGRMLEGRRDALRTKLSEAREAMVLAQRKAEAYEAKLKNLQSELETIRREFADDGVKQRDKLIHDAKQTAAQIIRDSERIGQQLIVESRADLRREIFEQVMVVLDQKLKGETLLKVDSALRNGAIETLKTSAQQSKSH